VCEGSGEALCARKQMAIALSLSRASAANLDARASFISLSLSLSVSHPQRKNPTAMQSKIKVANPVVDMDGDEMTR
jgi:hypothetical protein